MEIYKNLYFSGVISIQDCKNQEFERQLIEPQLKEVIDLNQAEYFDDNGDWQLVYSPIEFNQQHGPLKFQEYQLSQQQLREAAITLSAFRKKMLERS